MLNELRQNRRRYISGNCQNLCDRYKFRIATTEDFINVCQEVSGKDLKEFFKPWFDSME